MSSSSCPILGVFSGTLPDSPSSCAKLESECQFPDKLHYKVVDCANESVVLQDRSYICLDHWVDPLDPTENVLFTYTKRMDHVGHNNDFDQVHTKLTVSLLPYAVNFVPFFVLCTYLIDVAKICPNKSSNFLTKLKVTKAKILTQHIKRFLNRRKLYLGKC